MRTSRPLNVIARDLSELPERMAEIKEQKIAENTRDAVSTGHGSCVQFVSSD